MPTSYSVWRRARGVGSFAIVAVVPGISHDDANVPAGTDYEYGVTVNWP